MVPLVWTTAALLAFTGLWCLYRAVIGRGSMPGACRSCGYDFSGLKSATCPECGRDPRLKERVSRRRRRILAPIGLVCLVPLLAIVFPSWTTKILNRALPERELSSRRVVDSTTVQVWIGYRLPVWLEDSLKSFRIEFEPKVVSSVLLRATGPHGFRFEYEDYSIDFVGVTAASQADRNDQQLILANAPLDDLDGDGIPDLLIVSYSGGAHCCWTYTVLRLGESPGETMHLDAADGASFTRAGDATIIETIDSVWDYWNACFACGYKPSVVLRFSNGVLALAPELMARPLPSVQELAAAESSMREQLWQKRSVATETNLPEPDFWRVPLELLYSGHEREAITLLRRAWPEEMPNTPAAREALVAEFTKNFESSPWCTRMRAAFGR